MFYTLHNVEGGYATSSLIKWCLKTRKIIINGCSLVLCSSWFCFKYWRGSSIVQNIAMVDNPILYCINGKPSRNWRYHSSSNSGSSNSSRGTGLAPHSSRGTGLAPPTESAIGALGLRTKQRRQSAAAAQSQCCCCCTGATGYVRARIMQDAIVNWTL